MTESEVLMIATKMKRATRLLWLTEIVKREKTSMMAMQPQMDRFLPISGWFIRQGPMQ